MHLKLYSDHLSNLKLLKSNLYVKYKNLTLKAKQQNSHMLKKLHILWI